MRNANKVGLVIFFTAARHIERRAAVKAGNDQYLNSKNPAWYQPCRIFYAEAFAHAQTGLKKL
ncbi:hypothetical protein [Neisseria dumasiana]|uniref:Uncharacterized protein n=1 Tax=Neisseria dumasiana TaxID=1931275 RepID=A0ABX3WMF6_9NEIS|nr:hypothetical protein [Neisseria dumasiana]OSI35807.1 hypothetical protein BV913_03985 [Neisseria dumasiana]UOO85328.1 hypothetical protein LVJ88_04955 [Neisseria dumasiana]